jgi:nucleotide sugar dehydrogenase
MITNRLSMIGLGRLGLSIALCFEKAGWDVMGLDISSTRVDAINKRILKSREPKVEECLRKSTNLKATMDMKKAVDHAQIIYVSIATPSTGTSVLDTESLGKFFTELNDLKIADKHLVLVSTVMPNYIADVANVLLKDCPRTTVSYIPDGAVPISYGRLIYGISSPAMVLIGEGSKEAGDALEAAHRSMVENQPIFCRMNTTSAEITKLSISSFSAMKVAYANFVAELAQSTPNANESDILNSVGSDSRIGKAFVSHGYGFGGPCIPRDGRALALHSREVNVNAILLDATIRANEEHTEYLADRLIRNCKCPDDVIRINDVAFKQNARTDVIEESRKIALANALTRKGAKVMIRDAEPIIKLVRSIHGKKIPI